MQDSVHSQAVHLPLHCVQTPPLAKYPVEQTSQDDELEQLSQLLGHVTTPLPPPETQIPSGHPPQVEGQGRQAPPDKRLPASQQYPSTK